VGTKIISLQNPGKKMAKSEGSQKATIYLLEDPQSVYNKILKAVTDSENKVYLSDEKKGVKNLLNIYAAINDLSQEEAAEKFRDSNYKEFKKAVAESVKALLKNLQSKYNDYLKT
ncbi:tryptophan--tRNA ligase, partial [Mycoplasmopsis synoviae]